MTDAYIAERKAAINRKSRVAQKILATMTIRETPGAPLRAETRARGRQRLDGRAA